MACLVFSLNEMPCGVYILMTRVASTNIIYGRNSKEYEKEVNRFVGDGRGTLRTGTGTAGDKRHSGRGA